MFAVLAVVAFVLALIFKIGEVSAKHFDYIVLELVGFALLAAHFAWGWHRKQ